MIRIIALATVQKTFYMFLWGLPKPFISDFIFYTVMWRLQNIIDANNNICSLSFCYKCLGNLWAIGWSIVCIETGRFHWFQTNFNWKRITFLCLVVLWLPLVWPLTCVQWNLDKPIGYFIFCFTSVCTV